MADAAAKKFDVILVWKVDRFGRSLVEFIQNVILLDGYGIRFVACAGGLDTDKRNPSSKILMHLLAMLAEFEIDRIHERTGEGQKRYRELYARGKVGKDKPWQSRTGKNLPVGRPMKVFARGRAVEMRGQGMSWGKIAKELGANVETVRLALHRTDALGACREVARSARCDILQERILRLFHYHFKEDVFLPKFRLSKWVAVGRKALERLLSAILIFQLREGYGDRVYLRKRSHPNSAEAREERCYPRDLL